MWHALVASALLVGRSSALALHGWPVLLNAASSSARSSTSRNAQMKSDMKADYTVAVLGDLHLDPRKMDDYEVGREHVKALLEEERENGAITTLVSLGDLGESKSVRPEETQELFAGVYALLHISPNSATPSFPSFGAPTFRSHLSEAILPLFSQVQASATSWRTISSRALNASPTIMVPSTRGSAGTTTWRVSMSSQPTRRILRHTCAFTASRPRSSRARSVRRPSCSASARASSGQRCTRRMR